MERLNMLYTEPQEQRTFKLVCKSSSPFHANNLNAVNVIQGYNWENQLNRYAH